MELERIYGIRQGSNNEKGVNQYIGDGNNFTDQKSQQDLAKQIGIDQRQLQNYKKLNDLIPELQQLVETNQLKSTTAYKIWAKMPQEEQGKVYAEYEKLCGVQHGGARDKNYPLKTQEDIARELGISVSTIKKLKQLQQLSPDLQQLILED